MRCAIGQVAFRRSCRWRRGRGRCWLVGGWAAFATCGAHCQVTAAARPHSAAAPLDAAAPLAAHSRSRGVLLPLQVVARSAAGAQGEGGSAVSASAGHRRRRGHGSTVDSARASLLRGGFPASPRPVAATAALNRRWRRGSVGALRLVACNQWAGRGGCAHPPRVLAHFRCGAALRLLRHCNLLRAHWVGNVRVWPSSVARAPSSHVLAGTLLLGICACGACDAPCRNRAASAADSYSAYRA